MPGNWTRAWKVSVRVGHFSVKRVQPQKWLFAIALTFFLGEISLRVAQHYHPTVLMRHPNRYHQLKARPGDLSYGFPVNADGFKDRPFTLEKFPDEYRVAVLGDSFVFGMIPYEYGFCVLLEDRAPSFRFMNFGVIGASPEDYLAVLEKDAMRFSPDAVWVFLYAGNDFMFARRSWYERSALITFVYRLTKVARTYQGQDIRQNYRYDDDMMPFTREVYMQTQTRYARTYVDTEQSFRGQFNLVLSSLDAMHAICRRAGVAFRVVLLPDRQQFDADIQGEVARRLSRDPNTVDWLRPQRLLEQALYERQISYLDLLPAFTASAQRLYINHDIHLNIAGNRLVRDTIPDVWLQRDR